MDEKSLKQIGVSTFADEYRPILGLCLIVTVSLFIVSIGADSLSSAKRWWRKQHFKRGVINRLNRLNEDEKQILRYYYAHQMRANSLRVDDGVVQELVAEGIIYRSAQVGDIVEGFAHNISDVAWDYLNKHPDLLVGKTNTYRNDSRGWRL